MAATLSDTITDDELAALVAMKAAEHEQRSEWAGRRRSREAITTMGEPIPAELCEARDIDILRERHEGYWLASAAGFVRGLDPNGLGAGQVHVVSCEQLGIASNGLTGFTLPGRSMFEACRGHLPVTAEPGPVIVVSTTAILKTSLPALPDDASDTTVQENCRIWITGVVMHEVAHTVEQAVAGLEAPQEITVTHLRLLQAEPRQRNEHTAAWARAFGHLAYRAAARPPAFYWQGFATSDIRYDIPGNDDEWRLLLANEAAVTDPDEPLVDVIRRPFPDFDAAIERRRNSNPKVI